MITLEEKLVVLGENWDGIKKKVVLPLWNGRFKSMYESIKLDYDDFESLAGFELSKAIRTFDPKKSNLFTYATRVIEQKAKTELRDCTQRDRRKALYISESIDSLSEQNDASSLAVEGLFTESKSSKEILSDKMVVYLNKLSRLQKRVLFAMAEGYSNDEIIARLNITPKELTDACAALRSYRNVSLLY